MNILHSHKAVTAYTLKTESKPEFNTSTIAGCSSRWLSGQCFPVSLAGQTLSSPLFPVSLTGQNLPSKEAK